MDGYASVNANIGFSMPMLVALIEAKSIKKDAISKVAANASNSTFLFSIKQNNLRVTL